jgi:DNA repair exonuclease SbcCD nuclease subunit/DNA repair exonuclease SbcCD ATPase subunit
MIERIYQLADLHITANLERQEEYKKVLDRTIEIIKRDKREKMVVICGDLFHEKTRVYQEANVMARNFLKSLGDVCEIVIISGNHDVNICNEDRIDSIEATLCNLITENKINYIRDTRTHKIQGINFIMTKMESNKVSEIENKKKGEIYVALYHGTLYKSKTDEGYEFEDENKIKASDFKDYDYGMVGDIHKMQYMNKKRTIAYSGSLIQQNFGETIKNHGMLLWDLKKKKSEYIEVKNDYVFKTHTIEDINDTEIKDIENKKCRLKIRYKNIELKEIIKYEMKIKKRYDVKKIVREELLTNNNNNKEIINKISKKNFMEVYKKFSEEKEIKNDDDELKILKEIVDRENIEIEKTKRGIEICELEFENLVTYGEKNIINFKKLKGLNILSGKNGLGKSAIADIILFILYDRYSKNSSGKEILNIRHKSGYGILRLKLNGNKYTIKRTVNRQQSKPYIFDGFLKNNIVDEKIKEEKIKNISTDGKKEITHQILNMFGTYDEMTLTSIILQIGGNFIDTEDKKKRTLLIDIMGLNMYAKIMDECNNKKTSYTSNILKKTNLDEIEIDYEEKIIELSEKIKILEDKMKRTNIELNGKIKDKNILEYKVGDIKIDIKIKNEEYKNIIIEKNEIEKNKKEIKKEIEKKGEKKLIMENKKNQEKKCEILKKIIKYNYKNKEEIILILEKLKNEEKKIQEIMESVEKIKCTDYNIEDLEIEKINIQNKINEKKIQEEKLNIYIKNNKNLLEHKFNEKCECCKKNKKIHNNIGYIEEIDEIKKNINKIKYSSTDIIKIEEKIKNQKNTNENKHKIEITELKKIMNNNEQEKMNEILKSMNENEKYEKEIKLINESIERNDIILEKIKLYKEIILKEENNEIKKNETEKIIKKYEDNIENIENLKLLEKEEKEINKIINEDSKELKNIIEELGIRKKEKQIQEQKEIEIIEAQKMLNIYTKILNVYNLGFIEYVMKEQVDILEIKINNILRKLTNYEIVIKINGNKASIYRIIPELNGEMKKYLNVSQLCGYERVAFNIGIRIGLNSMNIMTKNNFLIIDEGFSAADNVNIKNFPEIIEVIKKEYEICILISHIDEIKNEKGRKIEIEYDENMKDSKIILI